MGTTRQAGVYVRISLDRTGQEAGVKRQEQDCRKLVAEKGWGLVEVYSDNDVSASNGAPRPAYERLLEAIRKGKVNAVVAWHPDRLYRRMRDLEDLIELADQHGVGFATVKAGDIDLESGSGKMVARILGSVARGEVDRSAERIRRWHEDRVAKGLPHGGGRRPFGYDWDNGAKTWRIRDAEAAVIRRIVKDLLRGRSLSSIVRTLNLEGVKTSMGGRWANGTVSRLVKTPTIAGLRVHARTGTTVKGNWKGIITPAQRELMLALFNDPSRQKRSGGPTERKRLLSGLLVCTRCGSKMYGDGPKAYACHKSWKGCGNLRISSSPLEDWVYWETSRHIAKLRKAGRLVDTAETEIDESVVEERLQLLQRRDDWAVKLAEGTVDDRAYKVGVRTLDSRIQELEKQLSTTLQHAPLPHEDNISIVFAPIPGKNFTALLDQTEIVNRYEVLKAVIERIDVKPASRRGARWNPERVQVVWKYEV